MYNVRNVGIVRVCPVRDSELSWTLHLPDLGRHEVKEMAGYVTVNVKQCPGSVKDLLPTGFVIFGHPDS